MDDINSRTDASYRPRWIAPILRRAAQEFPVVVLTGARQVGKSTLLREEAPFRDWRYLTLDDIDTLGAAERDPRALLAGYEPLVIDEVQRSPNLLVAIKLAVDEDRSRRFMLSGSANLLLMHRVSESLAGRAAYVRLDPMTIGEERGFDAPTILRDLFEGVLPSTGTFPSEDPMPWLRRGLLPVMLGASGDEAVRRWEAYVSTYLERDLRELSQVASLPDFRRLMSALALRGGHLLNQSEVGRDIGLPQATAHRYIGLLETGYLLHRTPAYSVNRTSRLVKSPKAYFFDPGLAAYLSGLHDDESLLSAREFGGIWESAVLAHIVVLCELMTPRPQVQFWRTTTGREVDFIIEHGRRLVAIEVKSTSNPGFGDARGIAAFMTEYPETEAGIVVHRGSEVVSLGERIVAVPWTLLAGIS